MHEIRVNLHIHTRFSDGTGTHEEIAQAALDTNLDVVIITDHNVRVEGAERYYRKGARRVLLLVGEEIHNPAALPQCNHLLVIGAGKELSRLASDTQALIDEVRRSNGACFIAHPNEHSLPLFNEPAIAWNNWDVDGYTGLELWNGLSELKSVSQVQWHAVFFAFFPQYIGLGPLQQTLEQWDHLTSAGKRVAVVGGADAHAMHFRLGPFTKTIFPYRFHFQAVNTHLFLPEALSGDLEHDRSMVVEALAQGHGFVGYDLPAPTDGFRFSAQGRRKPAWSGDEMSMDGSSVTLQIRLPQRAECHLLHNGRVLKTWNDQEACTHITSEPGVYRVEVYRPYLGKRRGWIFSNPIYLR